MAASWPVSSRCRAKLRRAKATAAKARRFQSRSAFRKASPPGARLTRAITVATSTQPPATITLPPVPGSPKGAGFAQRAADRIPRVLVPSMSDCFFMALVSWLFIFVATGWKSLLGDGDTGWHIRTGQYILAHHAVPTQDLFSFSRAGAPWFAWEWLSDVLYAALFQVGGLKAIVLVSGLMIGLFATIVLRYTLWRGANPLLAVCTTMLATGAASMHFLARPHLFTLLLVPACFWVLEADRREKTRWLWALIPITALWTNLHGGFVIFLVLIGLLIAGSALEAWLLVDGGDEP